MIAVSVDGYALGAIIVVCIAVIALATLVVRLMRDHGVRVARIGVFIERERVTDVDALPHDADVHHVDPLGDETRPAPLPPPTPPPPLPPRPHDDEPTQAWPQREESP